MPWSWTQQFAFGGGIILTHDVDDLRNLAAAHANVVVAGI